MTEPTMSILLTSILHTCITLTRYIKGPQETSTVSGGFIWVLDHNLGKLW